MSKSKRNWATCIFVGIASTSLLSMGCAGPSEMREAASASEAETAKPNDGLNSTLWALTSAEYDATALTVYHAAERAVASGLADSNWTALPEQEAGDDYSDLPPAVVLDVDETVLDNGEYQAELVVDDTVYSSESWLEWVLKERAGAIPGALAFTRHADARGVTVIYLTNRRGPMEQATRQNLIDLGFPVDTTFDVVLTRGERPEWKAGEKTSRRRFVAQHFRVLALVGDNLGDFIDIDGLGLARRNDEAAAAQRFWGTKWFMLPNPQYGSWESALFDGRYDLPLDVRRTMKIDRLRERDHR
jgi:acid phosphatase